MARDDNRNDVNSDARDKAQSAWQIGDMLNRFCHCIDVDEAALRESLEADLGKSDAYSKLLETHPNLMAKSPVFVSREHIDQMAEIIEAVENVATLQPYRDLVLDWVPDIGRKLHGPRGVFFGYDFHLTKDGPKLIEINTNAGGALLILHLAAAQQACCPEVEGFVVGRLDPARLEKELVAMFRDEFHLQFPGKTLRRVAIVDEDPSSQFLGPEFVLFERMFDREGIDTIIVGPDELNFRGGRLYASIGSIDLVYNRLTDFYLQSPGCGALDQAYREEAVALTPDPYAHALYANKRNLTVFSDPDLMVSLGADTRTAEVLAAGVPRTEMVIDDNEDSLWTERKRLFFKPVWGFGSKGTYRGAKLTRRKWQEIRESDYIAQALIPPSERLLVVDGNEQSLKLDVRCYVYDGFIQLLGARMYRGQTTNFRTDGGGLAAVFTTPVFT